LRRIGKNRASNKQNIVYWVFSGSGYFSELKKKKYPKMTIFLNVSEKLSNHWFHKTSLCFNASQVSYNTKTEKKLNNFS